MHAETHLLFERWANEALWDEVDELGEGPALAEELLRLMARPDLLAADERREAIWGNLWWSVKAVVWQARVPAQTRVQVIHALGSVYQAAAAAGVNESSALGRLWDTVLFGRCSDADDEATQPVCEVIFEVLSDLLEVPSRLVQVAALDGLEQVRDPRTRRLLEDARPFFVDEHVRAEAAYVRGALRRPP